MNNAPIELPANQDSIAMLDVFREILARTAEPALPPAVNE